MLAGADTALRTVARFAVRRRAGGRSPLDVQHVRDVLTGAFLDLLMSDCLALVATRGLHLMPRQTSAYAAAAAYLAPKIIAESMDGMSAVLGEESLARDGAYAMFAKQLRDLPVTSLGHAGSAGRQVSLLPQLPFFARHVWFTDDEAPAALFRLHGDLPPLDPAGAALLGDGDPLAATLVATDGLLGSADLPGDVPGDRGALGALTRALVAELGELRTAFAGIGADDRAALVDPRSFALADRYALVLAAAACLGVWREQRSGSRRARRRVPRRSRLAHRGPPPPVLGGWACRSRSVRPRARAGCSPRSWHGCTDGAATTSTARNWPDRPPRHPPSSR
ncbi:hypothetical protein LUW77_17995 [Streptomyces radiopugnans]|nr:hypothetical protein LUW77_17995 [Streptomyces radiopugnans]